MTLVLVDDHEDFRRSLRHSVEAAGLRVIGEAADGVAAIATVGRLRPDVVLLDVVLPGLDGFDVAERLARLDPRPKVVLISSRDAGDYRGRLRECPVDGFIAKHELDVATLLDRIGGGRG